MESIAPIQQFTIFTHTHIGSSMKLAGESALEIGPRRRWRLLDHSQENFSMLNVGDVTFLTVTLSYCVARRMKPF
jgi:hypothetical protein